MQIAGLQKSSLVDYPSKIAAVVFLQGCNFRCSFCHNGALLPRRSKGSFMSGKEFFNFLKLRKGKLDAVVISGGEPTLNGDLEDFIKEIKTLGFLIKLDTNGTNPKMLKTLAPNLDYVAMDIKAPLKKYHLITNTAVKIENIKESIDFLINGTLDYEFRTTVVKEELEVDDFVQIAKEIKGAKRYFLQKFVPELAQDENYRGKNTYTQEEFQDIAQILRQNIAEVSIR